MQLISLGGLLHDSNTHPVHILGWITIYISTKYYAHTWRDVTSMSIEHYVIRNNPHFATMAQRGLPFPFQNSIQDFHFHSGFPTSILADHTSILELHAESATWIPMMRVLTTPRHRSTQTTRESRPRASLAPAPPRYGSPLPQHVSTLPTWHESPLPRHSYTPPA